MKAPTLVMSVMLACTASSAQAIPIVFSASGPSATFIQATVDAFRTSLGSLNPNVAGSFGGGRREINWDGVPNALAAPNTLPGNFFNSFSPRGVELTTPGTGFQVSANAGVTPIEFGNINATYSDLFATFSAQRLFTSLDSNITDVSFFIPGSATAALTQGFGAVFTDVDLANSTSIEFFDELNQSLGQYSALNSIGDETLSFLGVSFTEGSVISRVRITSGNQTLAAGSNMGDLVVMDDFIYGEPVMTTVPVPASLLLLLTGISLLGFSRRASQYN